MLVENSNALRMRVAQMTKGLRFEWFHGKADGWYLENEYTDKLESECNHRNHSFNK